MAFIFKKVWKPQIWLFQANKLAFSIFSLFRSFFLSNLLFHIFFFFFFCLCTRVDRFPFFIMLFTFPFSPFYITSRHYQHSHTSAQVLQRKEIKKHIGMFFFICDEVFHWFFSCSQSSEKLFENLISSRGCVSGARTTTRTILLRWKKFTERESFFGAESICEVTKIKHAALKQTLNYQ